MLTEETLPEFLQLLSNPELVEKLSEIMSSQMPPPPLDQAPGMEGQVPGQAPTAPMAPPQAQPQAAVAPPNLGAAITGPNPVMQPDVAQMLQGLKLGGQ